MDKSLIDKNNGVDANSSSSSHEVVELLFKDTYKSSVSTFIVVLILLYVLGNSILPKSAALWLTIMLVAYGYKLIVVTQFFKDASRLLKSTIWLNRFNVATTICGLAWGSASLIIYPSNNTELQAFLGLTLAGIGAGGVIAYSFEKSTAILFIAGIAAFTIPAFLSDNSPYSRSILLLAGFFVVFVAITSKRLAEGLHNNLKMRIDAENQKQKIIELSQKQMLHMEHTPMGIIEWDAHLMVTTWNKACTNIFGYTEDDVVGKHISFLMPELEKNSTQENLHLLVNHESNSIDFKKTAHKNGSTLFAEWINTVLKDDEGKVLGMTSLVQDKTDPIRSQNKTHQLVTYDTLTRLPNRRLLLDSLSQTLVHCEHSQSFAMVIYIGLDHLKTIDNSTDYSAGDNFLITVSERLQSAVRKQDTVAKMDGDEFAIAFADIGKTDKEAYAFSQKMIVKIIKTIRMPVEYNSYQYYCSANAGICIFTGGSVSAKELIRRADMSMYLAKKQGRNNHIYYDETMQPKYDYQLKLKNDLNSALTGNQFKLYLQGQFNKNYKCVGAEVLIRWQHPKIGLVSPADFVPLIEESGLVIPIGNWILHQACMLLKKWEASPLTNKLSASVNVSAVQFNHQDFISDIESAIQSSDCDPTRLCIELTESAVVNSVEDIVYKMNYLRSMGVTLSIDDFGIGYSSLAILKRLPIDELKIDKLFVDDIIQGNVEGAVVQTILQLGKNFKLRIVAEGVETEYQLEYLQNYGCKIFQGHLFGMPSIISEFENTLSLKKSNQKA